MRLMRLYLQEKREKESLASQPKNPAQDNPQAVVEETLEQAAEVDKQYRSREEADNIYHTHCKSCDMNLAGCGGRRVCMYDHQALPMKCRMATVTCERWSDEE